MAMPAATPTPAREPDGVDAALAEIVRDLLAEPALPLHDDMMMADLPGWDSIRMVTMLLALEQRFGTTLRAAEVRRLRSVGDVARLVRAAAA